MATKKKKTVKKKESLVFHMTDPRIIPDVMEMVEKSDIKGIPPQIIERFLLANLGKDDTRLLVGFDGDNVNGFLLAYIVYPNQTPEVFIAWTYVDPSYKNLGKQFMESVDRWAEVLGIEKVSAIVRKAPEAFAKKYGLSIEYYGLSKRIKVPKRVQTKEEFHVRTF